MNYRDFWEAGYKVFGLYGVLSNGKCECGNPHCKALFKHPRVSNWQHTPHWSEEQLETMEAMGSFKTGYGILLDEVLVEDVDARNGGVASWARLVDAIPSAASAGMITNTGSGGGSKHHMFKIPPGLALVSRLPDYPGIDFKSGAAFIVGPGSMHASGNRYEVAIGSPDDIDMAPPELLELLKKPEFHRADIGGVAVDVSLTDLADMVGYVSNDDADYDQWIKIGMALHHASGGLAFDLWDQWSQKSSKYGASEMSKKWHSFGKSANPVTLGTLTFYAERNGWVAPVTFTPDVDFSFPDPGDMPDIPTEGVDLNRPPGFVGQVAVWIESTVRRKRERMSTMAALVAVGNVSGMRYTEGVSFSSANLMTFNVGGTGTGKEAVQDAIGEIHRACGFEEPTYGNIKSEQEIIRNLVRQQPAFYVADEVGALLTKIKNAQRRGGAPYLDGVIAILMSAYSKANSWLLLSGDLKEDTRTGLVKRLTQVEKQIEENGEKNHLLALRDSYQNQLENIGKGLHRPFVSVAGFTTNKDFNDIVDYETAVNGFVGRALLCTEDDTSPEMKENFVYDPLPDRLKTVLQTLAMGGSFDLTKFAVRIEYYGQKIIIPTDTAATAMLKKIIKIFDRNAYEHKSATGLEGLYMRGYEQVAKVSLILSIPGGLRTEEHVRWAYALVSRDIEDKMHLVIANDRVKDSPRTALESRIASLIGGDDGETLGVIVNKARGYKKEDIEKCLEKMVKDKKVKFEEVQHKYNKGTVRRYKRIDRK